MGRDDDPRLSLLEKQLEASLDRNRSLEKENEQLQQEILHLRTQLKSFKAQSSDGKFSVLKKLQNPDGTSSFYTNASTQQLQKPTSHTNSGESPELSSATTERQPRVPKPPPRPSSLTVPSTEVINGHKAPPVPPPPPPLPSKSLNGTPHTTKIRRVPEVMEFYRSLTRKYSRTDQKTNLPGFPGAANAREMIGEIENRSTYLLAIKSDVETHGEFIRFLAREVENAKFKEISDVEAFVRWLDEELSYLVDERAVLKHFTEWPERKADTMREAAFSYRDLKKLQSEVWSFQDNHKHSVSLALKRIQSLQDRLEQSVHNAEKMRDSACKRYREFQIPWEWTLDTGMIGQLKFSSMKLAKEHMKRVVHELQTTECPKEDIMLQAVRFAFRVHQFAGGFDGETMRTFEELRKVATGFDKQQQSIRK
ncbi:protein CHUP1, chloroplastic [Telopea speciosissima]|uniref:protein CHUP1, chloroplastic n=1 Tax=Telopea speciosissima TaxID=54955 RepID=UPI001CC756EB|nr:protein CHUP1, chloroplastic [Telopea speciosissima]XP_043715633.1 protein CHUP1, chloroplastic [Telopea speciosissima]